jgi:glycosyltransferase involved in cell wall biosynthesis
VNSTVEGDNQTLSGHVTPLVSVLMAVYNTESFLRPAIESVLAQGLSNLELIIIDDGSHDGSPEIAREYVSSDHRIVFLQNIENRGASGTLNRGLQVARGRFITRQDSDDISMPERLERQVDFLERNPDIGAVGCAVTIIDSFGSCVKEKEFPLSNSEIQKKIIDQMCFCGPTVMTARWIFSSAGFFFDNELSGSEDYDLCLRLGEVSHLANLKDRLYCYRQHSNSVSQRERTRQMLRKARALEKAWQRRAQSGVEKVDELSTAVARDYLRAAILSYLSGHRDQSEEVLGRVFRLSPDLVNDFALLEKIVRSYVDFNCAETAVDSLNGLFRELLPRNPTTRKIYSMLIAEVHMREVFLAARTNQLHGARSHLWHGLRHNPRWLRNRGVWSILRSLITDN